MPNRILREGIIHSDRVDKLDYPAEVFYRRLINVVDDYGRFDARPSMLKAACFPLRLDRVREADILRWTAECAKAELIVLYESDGKPFGILLNLGTPRAQNSKFPDPPRDICERLRADEIKRAQMRPYSDSDSSADSITSFAGANDAAGAAGASSKRRKSASKPKADPKETPEFRQLTDHFIHHHPLYLSGRKFQKFEGVVLADLWHRVGEDLMWAKGAIDTYLCDPSPYYEHHPINLFKRDMDKFISRAKCGPGATRHGNRNHATAGTATIREGLKL